MVTWLLRVSALISQTINCVLLFGHHDQTVSARSYLNRNKSGWRAMYHLVNSIFFWQEDHCKESHQRDIDWAKEVLKNGK